MRPAAADPYLGPIVVMWLVVTIGPMHARFVVPTVEAAVFGLVAAACFMIVRDLEPDLRSLRIPALLFALPLAAVSSAAWSPTPANSLRLGSQFLVIAGVGLTTLVYGSRGGDVERVVQRYFGGFVRVTVVLIAARLLLGPVAVVAAEENRDRFSLMGMHPNLASFLIGLALLIAAGASRETLRMRLGARLIVVGVLVAAVVAGHSRTTIAAVLVGFVAIAVVNTRRSPGSKAKVVTLVAVPVIAAIIVFSRLLSDFVLRGQDPGRVAAGNGRTELWPQVLARARTPFDRVFGLGYGQAKFAPPDVPWAVGAHNSLIAVFIGLGVAGVAIYALLFAKSLVGVMRGPLSNDVRAIMIALWVALVLYASATDVVAEPRAGLVVLYLMIVLGSWSSEHRPRSIASGRPTSSKVVDTAESGRQQSASELPGHAGLSAHRRSSASSIKRAGHVAQTGGDRADHHAEPT